MHYVCLALCYQMFIALYSKLVTARKVTRKLLNKPYNFMCVNGEHKIHLEVETEVQVQCFLNVGKKTQKAFFTLN